MEKKKCRVVRLIQPGLRPPLLYWLKSDGKDKGNNFLLSVSVVNIFLCLGGTGGEPLKGRAGLTQFDSLLFALWLEFGQGATNVSNGLP